MRPHLPHNYVALDLETTGLSPRNDHVLQIGIATVRNRVVVGVDRWFINHPIVVPPAVTRLNGITTDMIRTGMPLRDALQRFSDAIRGETVIGHNVVRFDGEFIRAAARRCFGIAPPDTSRWIDVGMRYRDASGDPKWSLEHIAERFRLVAPALSTVSVEITTRQVGESDNATSHVAAVLPQPLRDAGTHAALTAVVAETLRNRGWL